MTKTVSYPDYPTYSIIEAFTQVGGSITGPTGPAGPEGPTGPAGSGGSGGQILFFSYPAGTEILGTSGPSPSTTGTFPTMLPNGSKAIFNIDLGSGVLPTSQTFFFNVAAGHTAELIGTATYDSDTTSGHVGIVGPNNKAMNLTGSDYFYHALFVNGTICCFSEKQHLSYRP